MYPCTMYLCVCVSIANKKGVYVMHVKLLNVCSISHKYTNPLHMYHVYNVYNCYIRCTFIYSV